MSNKLPEALTYDDLDKIVHFRYLWQYAVLGQGVGVAIIDSGVNPDSELSDCTFEHLDFTGERSASGTGDEHGTAVAKIVHSIAPKAHLGNLRVIPTYTNPTREYACRALQHCIDVYPRYRIANMSIWFESSSCKTNACPLCQKVAEATERGILVVASSGNFGPAPDSITCPGYAPRALTVGASLPQTDIKWWNDLYLWRKWWLEFSGEIAKRYGTSFSTPCASGISALLISGFPNLSPDELKDTLKATATDLGAKPNAQGCGELNCKLATEYLYRKYRYLVSHSTFEQARQAIYFNRNNRDAQEAHSPYLSLSLAACLDYIEQHLIMDGRYQDASDQLNEIEDYLIVGCFLEVVNRINSLKQKIAAHDSSFAKKSLLTANLERISTDPSSDMASVPPPTINSSMLKGNRDD